MPPDRLASNPASYLIGIAGPSCSGKTEISRRLSRLLRAPVVAIDHYYRDLKHMPFERRAAANFDAPESLDRALIIEHVRRLKEGFVIEQPTYDFTRHVRAETVELLRPARFVIVEGLFALYWPALRDLLDCRVYVSADHDVCLARRIERDVRERGRTEESVRRQYENMVRPMCDRHIAPTESCAGVVLSGTDPVKKSVLAILRYIGLR